MRARTTLTTLALLRTLTLKVQSSQRIPLEHANAEHKQWPPLQRWIGRREYYDETHLAIASQVSDRAAERKSPTSHPARPYGPNRTPSH